MTKHTNSPFEQIAAVRKTRSSLANDIAAELRNHIGHGYDPRLVLDAAIDAIITTSYEQLENPRDWDTTARRLEQRGSEALANVYRLLKENEDCSLI